MNSHHSISTQAVSPQQAFASARNLVRLLRGVDETSPRPRVRVGVLLMTKKYLSNAEDVGMRIGANPVSVAQRVLDVAPSGSNYLNLGVVDLLRHLDELAQAREPRSLDCDLVMHLDLLLARFDEKARDEFWRAAREGMSQRPRALVMAMPQEARFLLPSVHEWKLWEESERVVALG